jgi:drug/metabolite transporter (DMT)-like permease
MTTQEHVTTNGTQSPLYRVAIIILYLALNISINLLNKFIISRTGFAFPLAISIAHVSFTIVALLPMMLTRDSLASHAETLRKNTLGLLVIGASFSVNIALNNISLTIISLSLNQMIRSSIPLVTATYSVFIDRTIPTRREVGALLAITLGLCAVLVEDVHAHRTGVACCMISTVANGLMMSISGAVLHEKLDVWTLTFYQAPITLVTLLPVFVSAESERMMEFMTTQPNALYVISLVMLTCIIALTYNVVHAGVSAMTSATTTTVIGQGNILLILVLSAVLLNERDFFELKSCVGAMIAFWGIAMYSIEKSKAKIVSITEA